VLDRNLELDRGLKAKAADDTAGTRAIRLLRTDECRSSIMDAAPKLMLAHKAGAMVAATQAVRRKIAPTMATVIGTSIMSGYMNAFELAQHAHSQLQF
jgi:hypothetical protein